ncbi:type II secretion system protein [bacterium]|nr:type II secretion system protein [bacterium]
MAFTLAETLIVMGIIGVVAALTLPNLNSSTGDKEKVAKVKKVYQNLNDAHDRAVAVYGPVETWFINDANSKEANERYASRILDFLKVSKDCAHSTGCFASSYKNLSGSVATTTVDSNANQYRAILADGTAIVFGIHSLTCTAFNSPAVTGSPHDGCGSIAVDIDNKKGPNILGKDYFSFDISSKIGIYPFGSFQVEYDIDKINTQCFQTGGSCTYWVVNYDNMDYLKANRSGKCLSGNIQLSQTNTTCK